MQKHDADVLLICGCTETKCSVCKVRLQEVIIQLPTVGKKEQKGYCKPCVVGLVTGQPHTFVINPN